MTITLKPHDFFCCDEVLISIHQCFIAVSAADFDAAHVDAVDPVTVDYRCTMYTSNRYSW